MHLAIKVAIGVLVASTASAGGTLLWKNSSKSGSKSQSDGQTSGSSNGQASDSTSGSAATTVQASATLA